MIWVIIAGIVVFSSVVLAIKVVASPSPHYIVNFIIKTFVVQNPSSLDGQFFLDLSQNDHLRELTLSFEVLAKGGDKALVMHGPEDIKRHFPQIKLLEIEDYTNELFSETDISIQIQAKPDLAVSLPPAIINSLALSLEDQLFWQIVVAPKTSASDKSTINLRAVIKSPKSASKSSISDKFNQQLAEKLALTPDIIQSIDEFQKRSYNPTKDVSINTTDLTNLIRI